MRTVVDRNVVMWRISVFTYMREIEKFFSTWAKWPPGDHVKFLQGHGRITENWGATVTFEWAT